MRGGRMPGFAFHLRSSAIALTLVAAALLCLRPVAAQTPEPAADAAAEGTTEIYNFDFDANQRMTVAVNLGATGPYGFIVDTASTRTVISRELATRLAMAPGPSAKI